MNFVNEGATNWSQLIKEELGIENPQKLSWMSLMARNHQIFEGIQSGAHSVDGGIYTTPLNTLGMGDPMNPALANIGYKDGAAADNNFHSPNYHKGSGDIPMSTLNMSLEVAAQTIGLELVQVVPAPGPWAILSYMDFPYAGGKLGGVPNLTSLDGKGAGDQNKPIYVKINVPDLAWAKSAAVAGGKVTVGDFVGTFIGFSRINGDAIVKVVEVAKNEDGDEQSIAEAMAAATTISFGDAESAKQAAGYFRADLVAAAADHVQGFSNFYDGSDNPMSRAENETGVGNTIGARIFTKLVQMGSYEVTGAVTRQQLQDMPLYGIDVVGKVMEAMQNELSQAINNRILDRVFKLGVENAVLQKKLQGVDLNLYFGATNTTKDLSDFSAYRKYVGLDGKTVGSWAVKNATQNTAAENVTTHQRRIMSRLLAASNLIANVSRFGRANWAVTNTQIVSALQDCAAYVVAPMVNTLSQDSGSLYFAGSIAGLNIYVDPYMQWEDTRICVGRKGATSPSGNQTPGVVFMPYILMDTVQIVAEGTMAPKLLTNSRFAIVDAGFHPAQNYYTFMVDSDEGFII